MSRFTTTMLVGLLLALPVISFAQDTGLVPCGNAGQPMCDTSFVAIFANGLIDFLITMLGVIAVIVLVIVGIQMVLSAGDPGAWKAAKDRFTNVIIGIIVILAAWLVVDTIMRLLTGSGLNYWSDFGVTEMRSRGSDTNPGDPNPSGAAGGRYTDAEARSALANAGISVWESAPGRTRFENINQATIDEAIRIREACGCAVTVTGGTESGHASGAYSHATGYKIDLDDSPGLTNYITANYTRSGTRSGDGAVLYVAPNGVHYYREGSHWDVLVQ